MFNLVRSKIHELGFANNIFNFLGKPFVSHLNISFCIIFLNIYHHAAKEINNFGEKKWMKKKQFGPTRKKNTLFTIQEVPSRRYWS